MSDTTDDMEFYGGLYERHMEVMQHRKQQRQWTMKNGEPIPVKKMQTGHILKCRRRIEMKITALETNIQELDENDFAGSQLSYAAWTAEIEDWQEWLAIMNKEIKRRMKVLKGKGQF